MNTYEQLVRGRARIAERQHWGKSSEHFFDYQGNERWCAVGAVEGDHGAIKLLRAQLPVDGIPGARGAVTSWNDQASTRHDQVLALFDRAIAAAAQNRSWLARWWEARHRARIAQLDTPDPVVELPDLLPDIAPVIAVETAGTGAAPVEGLADLVAVG